MGNSTFPFKLEFLEVNGTGRKSEHFTAERGFHHVFCRFKVSHIHFPAYTELPALSICARACQEECRLTVRPCLLAVT